MGELWAVGSRPTRRVHVPSEKQLFQVGGGNPVMDFLDAGVMQGRANMPGTVNGRHSRSAAWRPPRIMGGRVRIPEHPCAKKGIHSPCLLFPGAKCLMKRAIERKAHAGSEHMKHRHHRHTGTKRLPSVASRTQEPSRCGRGIPFGPCPPSIPTPGLAVPIAVCRKETSCLSASQGRRCPFAWARS